MYKLVGLKENVKNLVKLCGKQTHNDFQSLKVAYREFLRKAQPKVPSHGLYPIGCFWRSEETEELLRIFGEKSDLDDFDAIFDNSEDCQGRQTIDRIQLIRARLKDIDPDFYILFELVINTIFTAPSKLAGGGSTSGAIGCIWVNPRPHWDEQDILEFFVHEGTHNLVFLDELCHGHYCNYDELPKKENFSWSAILNKPRPLDKVFHSIIVSTEILQFRNDKMGHPNQPCLHPPTEILHSQTCRSIESIFDSKAIQALLTPRAHYLLQECWNCLKQASVVTF